MRLFSISFIIICTFVITSLGLCVSARTSVHNNSILITEGIRSYCDLKCAPNVNHTLCAPSYKPAKRCLNNFKLFNYNMNMDKLWHAHNGLRNRVASKYNVSNMKQLEWDMELAFMAKFWILQCEKYKQDPCTQQVKDTSKLHTLVNQNIAFIESKYLPEHFYSSIITKWYKEKRKYSEMLKPEIDKRGYARFKTIKNYTQLVWADTWRIGCAAAKYDNGFALVCNYHAMTTVEDAAWKIGKPCTRCPRNLPLCSLEFDSLCTADKATPVCTVSISVIIIIKLINTITFFFVA